jgi:acyl-CoA thioester hydrolase
VDEAIAAQGHFVHVDRATNKPVPIPDRTRRVLQGLVLPAPSA